jgi:hypothetical protein
MEMECDPPVSIFQVNPALSHETLKKPAGIPLPSSITEAAVLEWVNQRRGLFQYNDHAKTILDTRDPNDIQLTSPLDEVLEYLPNRFVLTWNVFDVFCDYFNVSSQLLQQLNRIDPKQSIVLVLNPAFQHIMAFPYFKNVNYLHALVHAKVTLVKLMEFQDQALILSTPVYPLFLDMNSKRDYAALYEKKEQGSNSRKRKHDSSEEISDEDGMSCDDDEGIEEEEGNERELSPPSKQGRSEAWTQSPDLLHVRVFQNEDNFI